MTRLCCTLLPLVCWLLAVPAEVHAAPRYSERLQELLGAQFIALGHCRLDDEGRLELVIEKVLRGSRQKHRKLYRGLLQAIQVRDGKFSVSGRVLPSMRERVPGERQVWFFFKEPKQRRGRVAAHPASLADGYHALLEKRQPDRFFWLVQQVDLDRGRGALEELFADPVTEQVDRLHHEMRHGTPESSWQCHSVLESTKLIDLDRCWGVWQEFPTWWPIHETLLAADRERFNLELLAVIRAEQDEKRLLQLLRLTAGLSARQRFELGMELARRPSLKLFVRSLAFIWSGLEALAQEARADDAARVAYAECVERASALLEERLESIEDHALRQRLKRMQLEMGGLIHRAPDVQPPPGFDLARERDILLWEFVQPGPDREVMRRFAGRELVAEHRGLVLKRLRSQFQSRSVASVVEATRVLAYLRGDDEFFQLLDDKLQEFEPHTQHWKHSLMAMGLQNHAGAHDAIVRAVGRIDLAKYDANRFVADAYAELRDPRATARLAEIAGHFDDRWRFHLLRARARHGHQPSLNALLRALKNPKRAGFLEPVYLDRNSVVEAILPVVSESTTVALQRYLEAVWPVSLEVPVWEFPTDLQGFAGDARRSTALAELARRDPRWLGKLALDKLGDARLATRRAAAEVFEQLTGQLHGYDPAAFLSQRTPILAEIEKWWYLHGAKPRAEWVRLAFAAHGHTLDDVRDEAALRVYAAALDGDPAIHRLAVEQITIITGKAFLVKAGLNEVGAQEKMTGRVRGWLKRRKKL